MLRLDKYLADAQVGTRTEVKKLIKSKKVMVNQLVVTKPETKIDETKDEVMVSGTRVVYEKFGYYLFHKPSGCVTANKDNLHKTVMDFFPKEAFSGYSPVGRLDIDTEGLLLITNDGQLAHHLISPSHHVAKTYYVELDQPLEEAMVEAFSKGVDIGEDELTKPAELVIHPAFERDGAMVYSADITIYEGKFHQVKRMFQAVERKVCYLKRISMGNMELGDLEKGTYRKLTMKEVEEISTNCRQEGEQ